MSIKQITSPGLSIDHEISVSNIQRTDLPSHLASQVRISDPTVWSILYAVNKTVEEVAMDWQALAPNIGFIMIGDSCPKKATQKVIQELNTRESVSPMSFINANAGAAISICATQFKFQGPSINFNTNSDASIDMAKHLATQWLQHEDVVAIFLVQTHYQKDSFFVTCSLVSNKGS